VGDLEKTLAGRTIVRVSKSGFNTQSALYVPLAAQDKILGVLQVQSYTPDRFTQTDVELLTLVGNTAAVAIQNAELFQMTQTELAQRKERERELETVTAISTALRKAPSRAEMLPVILDQLLFHLRVDGAALESYDSVTGDLVTEMGRGVWSQLVGDRIPRGAGLSALVIASGQPYFNNDALHDSRLFRQDLFGLCRAAAGVPLIVQGQITGLLWICSQRLLDEHDLHLLTAIGDMAANALRRATLHEQTQAQARQIAQIMDAVPQGVLLIDGAGTVLLANPVARRDLLILARAQVGAVIEHLGDRPLSELLTSPPMGLWHEVRTEQRIFEIIARPISNGPEPEEWVLVIDDTTQARQVQTEVQQQERLAAVGQLAAGIAHDINNVLGVIVLQAQMLAHSRWMPSNEMERVSIITEQSHHATDLIRQVLDFGRQSILERHALNLLSLLQEQIRLLERTLPEHLAVRLEHEPGDYVVYADATSIQQIVMNLAINARDAMPNGGSLTISLDSIIVESAKRPPLAEMAPGEWIRLRFIDTGAGIPREILPHIFDPFFTTKAPGQGSGLGLAQVHGIVAQHGGYIAVESQVAEGTISTIYLPALTQVTSVTAAASEPDDGPSGHDEVILIVEDNLLLRTSLREMLEIWGYQVREAVHGQDALKQLAEAVRVADLVLADVVMPEMGGVALVHAMRQRGWQMPVVLMSGHPLDSEITALAEYGVFTWLPKPVPLAQLAQALADALPPRSDGGKAGNPG
jgi:signal transduction histidine kinase/ActR/RegA family two-component response regulator